MKTDTRPCGLCFVPECYSKDEHDPNLTCSKCENPDLAPTHATCQASYEAYSKEMYEERRAEFVWLHREDIEAIAKALDADYCVGEPDFGSHDADRPKPAHRDIARIAIDVLLVRGWEKPS